MKTVMTALRAILVAWISVALSFSSHQSEILVFVIVDAENVQLNVVESLATDISSQAAQLEVPVVVYSTSKEWPGAASWTYFPLLERMSSKHGGSTFWVVFVGQHVRVKLDTLLQVLHTWDASQAVLLCRGVQDQQETIIHHFARVDDTQPFVFPDVRPGMLLSGELITRLAKKWTETKTKTGSEMNIDASHEFARFVKSAGGEVTSHPAFCVKDEDHCALTYSPPTNCGQADVSKIHFAVKSCEKYHAERLPVLHNTWLKQTINHAVYSDVKDTTYGTVSAGVANTERGHCGKTLAIIQQAALMEGVEWLVIADDDTLLSIEALSAVLGCHDHRGLVALGERYGYAAALPHGYDYITGGGGMVFSKPLVDVLASPGVCQCPTNDTPDDMFLGICLRSLGVPVTHSSAFHQARPMDYPVGRLEGERPVSFHKFWMMDPYKVFSEWLQSPTTRSSTLPQDEL